MEHMIKGIGFRVERAGRARVRGLRFLFREGSGGRS